jgi:hypothetical protein
MQYLNSLENKQTFLYGLVFLFVSYLFLGTGIHSDDIILVNELENYPLMDVLFPDLSKIHVVVFGIPSYYMDYLQYYFFGRNYYLYDIVKIIVSLVSLSLIYKFLNQYLNKSNSFLSSLFFVFFITHDSVNYWTMALPYLLVVAIIMHSHRLINQGSLKSGVAYSFLGSFFSFASPPYIFGLSIIFLIKKEWKKFTIFLIPQIIYIIYYFFISKVLEFSKGRIEGELDILRLIKQYILQVGTSIDSFIGPSFWLKVYYSILELSLISFGIGIVLVALFYNFFKVEKEPELNKKLLLSFFIIALLAFGIFALTGMYPQIVFNLGNRVTMFASLLFSVLIILFFMNNRISATIIFSIFIFSVLGLSDHWKNWNQNQITIINNISKNEEIKNFNTQKQLFVINNQYSKLGNLAHIEFFAQGMASHVFKYATSKNYKVSTLNQRFILKGNYLVDKKYNTKTKIEDDIYIYDSLKDDIIIIKKRKIEEFIKTLPKNERHWLLLLDKENFLMKIVLKLMPRLENSI